MRNQINSLANLKVFIFLVIEEMSAGNSGSLKLLLSGIFASIFKYRSFI